MYIHGSFLNRNGETVTVHIVTNSSQSPSLEIGNESDGILFTDDPVEITSEMNDTFDHLLCHSATINLQVKNYIPELFGSSCRDVVVNIYRENTCLFAGYIEPQTYSQPYNEQYDELSLNCIDCLSALQYSNYRNIGSLGVLYSIVKSQAQQRTFLEVLGETLENVSSNVSILASGGAVYYDGSKAIDTTTARRYSIFSDISISELLFLGDEEDDTWTQEDVLTEILRYLNLHIVQQGLDFYIFSWETIRNGENVTWHDIMGGDILQTSSANVTVKANIVADCDTQISVEKTYNQLLLTDNVTETENLVENPLDSNSLAPAYGNYQKYMTEYIAEGNGKKALQAFGAMINGTGTDWGDASQVDWYVWVKKNPLWKFNLTDTMGTRHENIYDGLANNGEGQYDFPYRLGGGVGAALMAFGKVEKKNGGSDNSPASAPSMNDYMVIGLPVSQHVNYPTGNAFLDSISIAAHGDKYFLNSTYLTDNDGAKLKKAAPIAEYVGNTAGGNFSPSDDDTTHYIEVVGKIALNPIMNMTECFGVAKDITNWGKDSTCWHRTMPSRNNGDGRYYTQRFYQATSWKDEVSDLDIANSSKLSRGIYPFTDTGPRSCEFNYNAANEAKDTVSKVGVLQCMLIIGDKCVVETLPDNGGSGNGEPSDFSWQMFKERSECADDDEYYAQSFSIGFDPKLKDCILGTEFDIQKNAPYTIGVTVEGTLIPIRKSDKVSGQVRFYILGPVNEEWLNVTKRHKTWFRKTKYFSNSIYLLEQTASIMIKDFEIKVVSDNGKVGAISDDKDIVYMSDTREEFVNKKDDLEFKITTALTSAECKKLGVNNAVKLSSPQNATSGDALLAIHDYGTEATDKPEKLYVDAYWQEWHAPRVTMEQNFIDRSYVSFFNLYTHSTIGKTFHVEGISRNLIEGTAKVTMKEIF